MVKYSFVLPAYKAHFFKEAIDSIIAQTYKDFELIIVNDASPEDLGSIVKYYNDSRIRYFVNEENIGGKDLIAQWNHCLQYAKGDYIILASDDDIYHPEYLEKMDKLICKYPDVNIFRPRVQHINSYGSVIRVEGVMNEKVVNSEYLYFWIKNYIFRGIPFWICKRSTLITLGGYKRYPLGWYSDDDMVLGMAQPYLVFSNEVLFSFRLSNLNISSSRNSFSSLKQKLIAINDFYKYILSYKTKYLCIDKPYTEHMSSFVKEEINEKWVNNEITYLLYTVSYMDLLKITSKLIKIETIDIVEIIKIHLKYIKRKIFK